MDLFYTRPAHYLPRMTFEITLQMMSVALAFGLLSLWQVRRKRKPGALPWVPWHGVMFLALLALIVGAAHLPAVWPR